MDENLYAVEVLPAPTMLSGWIRAAVEDAQRIAKLPGFRLNMGCWNMFDPELSGYEGPPKCQVCLAGAVLVGRGRERAGDQAKHPRVDIMIDGKRKSVNIAYALNDIRVGYINGGLVLCGIHPSNDLREKARRLSNRIYAQLNDLDHPRPIHGLADWGLYLELADMLEQAGY